MDQFELEPEVKDAAIALVLSYMQQMNDWQHRRYLLSRLESGQVINHASDRALVPDEPIEVFHQYYHRIFAAHCTERKRTYGGDGGVFARHGMYQGASLERIRSVIATQAREIEVVIEAGTFDGCEFAFVLVKKAGDWRIDRARTRINSTAEWGRHLL